jgi:hypothetical protein
MIWMWLVACGDKVDNGDTGTEDAEVVQNNDSEEPSNEPSGEASSEPSAEPGSEDTQDTDTEETDTPIEEDCPDDVVCVNTFPFSHEGDTSRSMRDEFDSYGCSPSTNESGAELLYRVTLPDDGFLALNLPEYAMESGADVDVHLLGSENSNDCIDRGHWAAGSLLTAGTYWVVVDTWVNSAGAEQSGNYELEMGFTSFSDMEDFGMDTQIAEDALFAFDTAWHNGDSDRFEYAITDFSLHSSLERMWIVDFISGSLLGNLHLAHGAATSSSTDDGWAVDFSNISESHQSSLGMMKGAESYYGSFDYSMRLDGLENGYNDKVRSRAIVVHGWTGSRPEYVQSYGSVAPTWGCPSVDDREIQWVVDTLKDGSLLFFWYPDGDWSLNSDYIQ